MGRKNQCADLLNVPNLMKLAVVGIPIVFIALFASCIFIKSKLILTPVTLVTIVLAAAVFFVSKYKQNSWLMWLIGIFLLAFSLRLLFIIIWPITPLSDCERAYNMSAQLNAAAISNWHEVFAGDLYYYDVWSMHVPFIVFQTFCMRLFGENLYSLQVVNMLFSSLTCVFTAMCAEGLSHSKRVGVIAGLLMALNITTLFMASFIVNQHVSTCFFVISLFFIIKKPFSRNWLNYTLSGLALSCGHLMRPEMYIVVIAVFCMFVYDIIKNFCSKNSNIKNNIIESVKKLCCFVLAFFLILNIADAVLLNLRWTDSSIMESKLTYKMMIGLNQETEGRFKDADYPLAANDLAVKEVLKERMSGSVDTAVLMIKKLCFQFSSYNYWWLQADKGGDTRQFIINHIFEPITQSYMFIILLLALISSVLNYKKYNKQLTLLYIIFLGFICAFALMEVQQRYAYITVPVMTIIASLMFCPKQRQTDKTCEVKVDYR